MQPCVVLLSLVLSSGFFRGPSGPKAVPKLSTPEYGVEGRIKGAPIDDHFVTLEVQVDAGEGRWLEKNRTPTFDVGGGCCFEQLHYAEPKLTTCPSDTAKSCRAVFAIPFRVGSHGVAGGNLTFSLCTDKGCTEQKVGVAVPID